MDVEDDCEDCLVRIEEIEKGDLCLGFGFGLRMRGWELRNGILGVLFMLV